MGTGRLRTRHNVGGWSLQWRGSDAVAARSNPTTGKPERIRLGKPRSASDARAMLERFVKTHAAAADAQSEPTVGELWSMFMAARDRDGFNNTIYGYQWRSLEPHFGHRLASSISEDICRDYAKARFAIGRAPATVWTELTNLRACLAWSVKNWKIDRLPPTWAPRKGKPRSRVMTVDEMRQLLEGARQGDPHIQIFVLLALSTGARKGAILGLTWDRVDLDRGVLDYDENIRDDPMSKSYRKGRARVRIGPTLLAALRIAHAGRQSEYVVEHGGHGLKDIRDGFSAACTRAGVHGVTPHTIRHSIATMARSHGSDIKQLAHLLGHRDSRTTELVYSHLDETYSEGVVGIIDAELSGENEA